MNLILCIVCCIYLEIFFVCSIMYTDHPPILLSIETKVSLRSQERCRLNLETPSLKGGLLCYAS